VKWTLCLLTGTFVSMAVFLVNYTVENIAAVKFAATFDLMATSYLLSFMLYAAFNCGLVLIAAILVVFFAPVASGSGIPDVKAYLNGVDVPGVLLARTLMVKMIGCICSVAGSLAVGKEGPFMHIGALFTLSGSIHTSAGSIHVSAGSIHVSPRSIHVSPGTFTPHQNLFTPQ
jgi:chloride channel 7